MSKNTEPEQLVRLNDIVGDRSKGIPAIISISKSSWWRGVREGKYPKGIKLGPCTTVWKMSAIQRFIEKAGK